MGGPLLLYIVCYKHQEWLEDMQDYVLQLYKRDPRMRGGGNITAWLFKSKTPHRLAPERADYGAQRETRGDRLSQLQDLREKDPKYDAKMLYTNMYKATTGGQDDGEVFAMEQGVGMQIQDKKDIKKKQNFMAADKPGACSKLSRHRRREETAETMNKT
ncbi:hypothetical protein, conserved [Eimeria maxima]|uniref:Uncharacterized protein n=1 Tax=Eimeria maxima TaxID=5804 RepID=U6M5F3_EIMMA|nr:hypothetical protein, conserved [Eimeria maxima]CDJ57664.1 hypothetical protein, conserved [Eimeria maxima]